MRRSISRILLAGTGSGCGKTTVVCGVLGALKGMGREIAAFKCGPDYIDPMFHRSVLGIPSHNLDLFLCGEGAVPGLLARNTPQDGVAVLEGVMGFYDGIGGGETASTCHLARVLQAPVVLVVNARGKALSLAAEVQGYLRFAPNTICGVILNNVTERTYPIYREMLEKRCGVEVLGYLPQIPRARLESRHLGLVTAEEVEDLRGKMALLAAQAQETICLGRLLELAEKAPPLEFRQEALRPLERPVRIAVARDEAFCFCYQDNLELLEELGAELAYFSPLRDRELPRGSRGLILYGGYPELYAQRLSENRRFLEQLRERIAKGLPVIAECGGFLLLCQGLDPGDGRVRPMAGVLPGSARMTGRLGRFGYLTLTAGQDNLLCKKGETLHTHEFHYSRAEEEGRDMIARKPGREEQWTCVHATPTLWAGYPHIHFGARPESARRFLEICQEADV